jgi:hypothetical protein
LKSCQTSLVGMKYSLEEDCILLSDSKRLAPSEIGADCTGLSFANLFSVYNNQQTYDITRKIMVTKHESLKYSSEL